MSAQAHNSATGDEHRLIATPHRKNTHRLTKNTQMSNLDTAPRSPNSNQVKKEGALTRCETSSPSAKDAVENSETNSLPTFTNLTFKRKPFELKNTPQFLGSNEAFANRMNQLKAEHFNRMTEPS